MQTQLYLVEEFCNNCQIDITFIDDLVEIGLIELVHVNEQRFIDEEHLPQVQRFVQWHYDYDINTAGIDTVHRLLQKMDSLHQEIALLKSKLSVYAHDLES